MTTVLTVKVPWERVYSILEPSWIKVNSPALYELLNMDLEKIQTGCMSMCPGFESLIEAIEQLREELGES